VLSRPKQGSLPLSPPPLSPPLEPLTVTVEMTKSPAAGELRTILCWVLHALAALLPVEAAVTLTDHDCSTGTWVIGVGLLASWTCGASSSTHRPMLAIRTIA
jgi:hypothetical protein